MQSKAAPAAFLFLAAPRTKGAVKHLMSAGTEQETFPV